MRTALVRPKTEHDKLCTIVPNSVIGICTSCDLPETACGKRVCKERYDRLLKEIKDGKKQ